MQANWSANIVPFFLSVTGTVWLGILPFQDHINLHNPYFLDRGRAAMRMRNSAAPVFLTLLDNWQFWTELPTRGVLLETNWQMQTFYLPNFTKWWRFM